MRIGIFGGTFDPVHFGHLLLAERCREQARLDEVWFMPAAVSPLKQSHPPGSDRHRLEMLALAIGGHEAFRISTLELDRGGVSYTFETLATISSQRPNDELYFLMGADSLKDFSSWREPQRICESATPLVVRRHGSPEPDFGAIIPFLPESKRERVRESVIDMPVIELSSTELRERAASGRSIRYCTPRAVEKYIETHGLYRE